MRRRAFLGTLLASLGALTIDPASLLWTPSPVPDLPGLIPSALVTLNAINKALLLAIRELYPASTQLTDGVCLGMDGLIHQLSVTMEYPHEIGPDGMNQAYIVPAAAAFAARLYEVGATRFGRLPHPLAVEDSSVVSHRKLGMAIRGVQQYDVVADESLLRFDMLCGAA